MKQRGFTLIELLVVIVIIGILATISVATFSGYFTKARDSERQAAIRNAATVMKTARAVNTITTFDQATAGMGSTNTTIAAAAAGQATVDAVLSEEGGYAIPSASTTAYNYSYVGNGTEFAVFTCAEETAGTAGGVIVDGTAAATAAVNTAAATLCPATRTAAALITASSVTIGGTDYTPIDVTN